MKIKLRTLILCLIVVYGVIFPAVIAALVWASGG
ncbi:hypothetical protein EV686_11416 [Paracandidimonas soli]|uniref:Uncharacterized protein n=1 Tax=Paracandidimonas soli TaxID=1917182 RepID=A0A4V2VPZ2_9BURK|nr:hypothetical protein EV686_11416 [Paracandidimonas soli]